MEEPCDCPEGLPEWLATFADLMSLLLCFFVLIVSFSSVQEVEFKKAMGSLQGALGVLQSKRMTIHMNPLKAPDAINHRAAMFWDEVEALEKELEESDYDESVKVERTNTGLRFTLQDQIVFSPAQVDVKPAIFSVLKSIAELTERSQGVLRIEGHSDNVPIRTSRFPSNWELSSLRAINVLHHFESLGIDRKSLACAGLADTQPLDEANTPEARAKNRRVEIFLELNPMDPLQNTIDMSTPEMNFIMPGDSTGQ